eukprot:11158871-Lingulodinium_polyedra.AAC.1
MPCARGANAPKRSGPSVEGPRLGPVPEVTGGQPAEGAGPKCKSPAAPDVARRPARGRGRSHELRRRG